jgi:hypothetical protein
MRGSSQSAKEEHHETDHHFAAYPCRDAVPAQDGPNSTPPQSCDFASRIDIDRTETVASALFEF